MYARHVKTLCRKYDCLVSTYLCAVPVIEAHNNLKTLLINLILHRNVHLLPFVQLGNPDHLPIFPWSTPNFVHVGL